MTQQQIHLKLSYQSNPGFFQITKLWSDCELKKGVEKLDTPLEYRQDQH